MLLQIRFPVMIALTIATFAQAQIDAPQPSSTAAVQTYSFESKDWGVPPQSTPKKAPYHGATPTTIKGGRVIKTLELKALLDTNKDTVVVDVLDSKTRTSIPGAYWMPGAGDGQFYGAEKSRFAAALEKLTNGDKKRPLVFLCISSECWLSYNASLYAIEAGYQDVIWYRGGTNSWVAAELDWKKPRNVAW